MFFFRMLSILGLVGGLFSLFTDALRASQNVFLHAEELCDPVEGYFFERDKGILWIETNHVI